MLLRGPNEDAAVAVLTMANPARRNAFSATMVAELAAHVDALESWCAAPGSSGVGLLLRGEGTFFCSGMDLKGFLRGESPSIEGRGFGGIVQKPPEKPLIAAVEGYALAGGLELMIACDLVTANTGAKFGIPEVKRGLVAAAGGVMMLPDQIPERIAMELALTGDFITAQRAYVAAGL